MTDPRAEQIRAGYAPIAGAYRAELGGELAGKPLDRAFLAAFVERCRGTIADLGCGPGHVARFLADLGAEVEGVDLSPAMIAEARAQFPALTFRRGSTARRIPTSSTPASGAICSRARHESRCGSVRRYRTKWLSAAPIIVNDWRPMKKLQHRKLTLRAENVRLLADRELIEIGGGLKITDASNASRCLGPCTGYTVGACSDVCN